MCDEVSWASVPQASEVIPYNIAYTTMIKKQGVCLKVHNSGLGRWSWDSADPEPPVAYGKCFCTLLLLLKQQWLRASNIQYP
jgi:hypothetical protein